MAQTTTTVSKKKVTAQLTISCGCGLRAASSQEAAKHVEESGHTMTVNGVLRPSVDLGRMNKFTPSNGGVK